MPSKAVNDVLLRLWAIHDIQHKGNDQHGYDACCPAHDDHNPSFHVGEGHDGRALVYCHAGCTLEEIAAALQMEVGELFEPEREDPPPRQKVVVERYDYTDEQGKLLYQVERLDPKGFRQRRPGNGQWEYSLGDVRRVLYRLPNVIKGISTGEVIHVVEGERDVHTLEARGKVATTCPGGAGKWLGRYSEIFKGAKVAIIRDMDEPGAKHARQVKRSLEAAGATVRVFAPAAGKDISDHIAAGLGLGEVVQEADAVPPPRLQVLTAPEVMAQPDPDAAGYLLGPLIYKGYRIVVGGHTGHGKTTFCMHMTAAAIKGQDFIDSHFHGKGGLRALVIDVEQGTKSVKRVLREVGLDDDPRVEYLRVPDGLALDSDKDAILTMERIFYKGRYDIVLADPLYKLHRGDPNDSRAATELMRRFDDWRDRYQFALLLPMHCRKRGGKAETLTANDLFGSATYQWGAELLLGIERPRESDDGFSMLHCWKDRDGELSEVVPLNGIKNLMFERGKGFRWGGKRKRVASVDVIHDLLREHSEGLHIEEIEELWPGGKLQAPRRGTLYKALDSIYGCTHDGRVGKEARLWQLPGSLLERA